MVRGFITPFALGLTIIVGVLAGGGAASAIELPGVTVPVVPTDPVDPPVDPPVVDPPVTPPVTETPVEPPVTETPVTPPAAVTPTTPRTPATPRTPVSTPVPMPSSTPEAVVPTITPTPTPTVSSTPEPTPSSTQVLVDTREPASAESSEDTLAIVALVVSIAGVLGLAVYFVVRNRATVLQQLRRLWNQIVRWATRNG
jgi:outer membrane biosynthesis protein TonB